MFICNIIIIIITIIIFIISILVVADVKYDSSTLFYSFYSVMITDKSFNNYHKTHAYKKYLFINRLIKWVNDVPMYTQHKKFY